MPEATVLKIAVVPGQFVRLVSREELVLLFTTNVAVFVIELQLPDTTTLYDPASDPLTLERFSVLTV